MGGEECRNQNYIFKLAHVYFGAELQMQVIARDVEVTGGGKTIREKMVDRIQ